MPQQVISFHYTLSDSTGRELDSSRSGDPLPFLTGASQIIPGLEKELLTLKVGDSKVIAVAAKEAYGDRNDDLVIQVEKDKFPQQEIKVGDQFQAGEEAGSPPLTAIEVTDSHVTLDGNHPLAGVDLSFDVEVTEVRDATEEELKHGHAHGPNGHQH